MLHCVLDEAVQGQKFKSIKLRHPGSEKPAQFLISGTDNMIYELLTFNEKHRSWFIGDSVASNGLIYMPMAFDPLYLVLNYLVKCDPKRVEPLSHVLEDEDFPDVKNLMQVVNVKEVNQVSF